MNYKKFNNSLTTEIISANILCKQCPDFCDASPPIYRTVAYFKYMTEENVIIATFIMSKLRVSPLKKLPLHRLEFMAEVNATQTE